MINVNDFKGLTDNETIEKALANLDSERTLVISPRISDIEPERDFWLLDRAILLPQDTTLIIRNTTIKLSDNCRDNFIRSANCGIGITNPINISNIHIKGEGRAILIGADKPRSTGDGEKILANPCPYLDEDLCKYADWIDEERRKIGAPNFEEKHNHSFGTDAGKEGESQVGDWRNIGILLAKVDHFSISGIKIVDSHGWNISLEDCSFGSVEKIEFWASMYRNIDGMLQNSENQDGIDLRNGCHDIIISDITGRTGDDVIALTAIAIDTPNPLPSGSFCNTHVLSSDWKNREKNIYNVIIRNVMAYSSLCFTIRLLPGNTVIKNIVIDNVIDTSPEGHTHGTGLELGNLNPNWGLSAPDSICNLSVSNVVSKANSCISIVSRIKDSCFTNIIARNPNSAAINLYTKDAFNNVKTSNLVSVSGKEIDERWA